MIGALARRIVRARVRPDALPGEAARPTVITRFYDAIRGWRHGELVPEDGWPQWLHNRLVIDKLIAEDRIAADRVEDGLRMLTKAINEARQLIGQHASGATGERYLVEYYETTASLLHIRRGQALAGRNPVDAGKDFDAAIKLQPSLEYAYVERARFYARQGRFDEAERSLLSLKPILPSGKSRAQLAKTRAALAGDYVEGGRRSNTPLDALSPLDAMLQELANLEQESQAAETLAELLGSRGFAAAWKGVLLSELHQEERAALAFSESLQAYEAAGPEYLAPVLDVAGLLGDVRIAMGDETAAAEAYKRGWDDWAAEVERSDGAARRDQASALAAKYALARVPIDGGAALDIYAAAFPGGSPGPFERAAAEARLPARNAEWHARLLLALDRRLRETAAGENAEELVRTRDLVGAIRSLIAPLADLAEEASPPADLLPFPLPIQLVVGGRADADQQLLGKVATDLGGAVRDRIRENCGFELPGINFHDDPAGGPCRLYLRGRAVERSGIDLTWQQLIAASQSGRGFPDPLLAGLETIFAPHLWELCVRDLVWLLLARNSIVAATDEVSRREVEAEPHLTILTRRFRSELQANHKLIDVLATYRQLRDEWKAKRPSVPKPLRRGTQGGGEPNARTAPGEAAVSVEIHHDSPDAARHLADQVRARLDVLAADLQIPSPLASVHRRGASDGPPRLVLRAGDWHAVVEAEEWEEGLLAHRCAIVAAVSERWRWQPPPEGRRAAPSRSLWGQIGIEATRLGIGMEAARSAGAGAAQAASRGERAALAVELAFAPHISDRVKIAAGDAVAARLRAAADGRLRDLRRQMYEDAGVWIPRIVHCRDAQLAADGWRLVVNRLRIAARALSGPANGDILLALPAALARHLDAFVSLTALAILVHRLGENRPVLVANLVQRWPLDEIVRVLRNLLRLNRSIRDLESIAEALLDYERSAPPPSTLEPTGLLQSFDAAAPLRPRI